MRNAEHNVLYIVVPCYNEEAVLPETAKRLYTKVRELMAAGKISERSRIVFVNDGSRDATWDIICRLHEAGNIFSGISLSRNRGHQNALLAGLMTVREKADMVISMDADLQDDIDAVDAMVDKYLEGYDIVYGVRSARETDTAFKRSTALWYYKLVEKLGGEVVYNHADYRLMSRRALQALSRYREQSLFLRGIVPMIGLKTTTVEYERAARFAGESKYPLKKMLALAADGITSLSAKPLRLIFLTGILSFLLSFVLAVFSIVRLCQGYTLLNWKIICFCIFFMSGVILTALGVIGEYIGKILLETKARPRYFVGEIVHED